MEDKLEGLERLARLRDSGALNPEEFEDQKARLLASAGPPTTAPRHRPNVSSMGLAGWGTSIGLIGAAVLTIFFRSGPEDVVVSTTADSAPSPAASGPATCDSAVVRQAVADAIEQNAISNLATLRLLDMRDVRELKVTATERLCEATLVMNSSTERTRVAVTLSSQGDTLVFVGDGADISAPVAAVGANVTASGLPATAEHYAGIGEGEVGVRLIPAGAGAYSFSISTASEGCAGGGDGHAVERSGEIVGAFADEPACKVTMRRQGAKLEVSESPECSGWHGAACAFIGTLDRIANPIAPTGG